MSEPAPQQEPDATERVHVHCDNPECIDHISATLGRELNLVVGALCETCRLGKITTVWKRWGFQVDVMQGAEDGPVITLRMMTPHPYGGFVLRFEDSDSAARWGGASSSDSEHHGARYVAELQHDLLRLGFFSPSRGPAKPGNFELRVAATLIDFKTHLLRFYQRDTTMDLAEANSSAIGAKPKIYFPPHGLVSPYDIFPIGWWRELLDHANKQRGGMTFGAALESWVAGWVRLREVGAPSTTQELEVFQRRVDELRGRRDEETDFLSEAHRRLGSLKKSLRKLVVATDLERAESEAERLHDDTTAQGTVLDAALDDAQEIDRALPPPQSKKKRPASTELVPSPRSQAPADDQARNDRMHAMAITLEAVLDAHDRGLAVLKDVVATAKPRRSALEKKVKTVTRLGENLEQIASLLVADIRGAAESADLLHKTHKENTRLKLETVLQVSKADGELKDLQATALQQVKVWLQPEAKPAGGGSVTRLERRLGELETALAPVGPPPQWTAVEATLRQLRPALEKYETAVDRNRDTNVLFEAYRFLLRDYGALDRSTARYLRIMVREGRLNDQVVFRVPRGEEVIHGQGLEAVVEQLGLTDHFPTPIMRTIAEHESAGGHTMSYGGRAYVILGVDWNQHRGKKRIWFDERYTSARQPTASRGWGLGQVTYGSTEARPSLTARAQPKSEISLPSAVVGPDGVGAPSGDVMFTFRSGIPYVRGEQSAVPLLIASADENLAESVRRLRGFFNVTEVKRPCTYDREHNCTECSKNLNPGTPVGSPSGIQKFDETTGDFVKRYLPVKAGAPSPKTAPVPRSFTFRRTQELRALLAPDGTSFLYRDRKKIHADEEHEFPCSWLAAIQRYGGGSEMMWYYPLDILHRLRKK